MGDRQTCSSVAEADEGWSSSSSLSLLATQSQTVLEDRRGLGDIRIFFIKIWSPMSRYWEAAEDDLKTKYTASLAILLHLLLSDSEKRERLLALDLTID